MFVHASRFSFVSVLSIQFVLLIAICCGHARAQSGDVARPVESAGSVDSVESPGSAEQPAAAKPIDLLDRARERVRALRSELTTVQEGNSTRVGAQRDSVNAAQKALGDASSEQKSRAEIQLELAQRQFELSQRHERLKTNAVDEALEGLFLIELQQDIVNTVSMPRLGSTTDTAGARQIVSRLAEVDAEIKLISSRTRVVSEKLQLERTEEKTLRDRLSDVERELAREGLEASLRPVLESLRGVVAGEIEAVSAEEKTLVQIDQLLEARGQLLSDVHQQVEAELKTLDPAVKAEIEKEQRGGQQKLDRLSKRVQEKEKQHQAALGALSKDREEAEKQLEEIEAKREGADSVESEILDQMQLKVDLTLHNSEIDEQLPKLERRLAEWQLKVDAIGQGEEEFLKRRVEGTVSTKDEADREAQIRRLIKEYETRSAILKAEIDDVRTELEKLRSDRERLRARRGALDDELAVGRLDKVQEKRLREVIQEHESVLGSGISKLERKIGVLDDTLVFVGPHIDSLRRMLNTSGLKLLIWGNSATQYGTFVLCLIAVLILGRLVRMVFRIFLIWLGAGKKSVIRKAVLDNMAGPLECAVFLGGAFGSLRVLNLSGTFQGSIYKGFETLALINVTWLLARGVNVVSSVMRGRVQQTKSKLDDQLLPIVTDLSKFAVYAIALIVIVESLGYPASSLIAGLGIGGLAFALAAKDTLSNFFGSITIFLDMPFQIGDWVIFGSVEGIVEGIGLRSTKIRTWSDTLITVPNSTVANATIENVSLFRKRRVSFKLGIAKDTTPARAEAVVAEIRARLDAHPDVVSGHYIFFNEFTDSALSIMVYYFIQFTSWREYLDVRQQLNLEFLRILETKDVKISYPTRNLIMDERYLDKLPIG